MSSAIERPVFYENQILGAADLTATVESSRGQDARHNRYLILWGIASGLAFSDEPDEDEGTPFKKITLSAGYAIDGTGREIVVPDPVLLSDSEFAQSQLIAGLEPDAWFPVFLVGKEKPAPQAALSTGACNSSAPTRLSDSYEIKFGRPGDERKLTEQDAGKVSDGPGKGGWKILLGFVQWENSIEKFKDFKNEVSGFGRRYAGVQADEIAARGGSLKIRTQTAPTANKPAILLDETGDGRLQFGSLDSRGTLVPVFTVDAQGNVTAEGKIKWALTTGTVQIESGIATDGMILPLPPGITEKQVADGDAIVQTQISLRMNGEVRPPGAGAGTQWGAFPLEVWVDTERRVHCSLRWVPLTPPTIGAIEDHPADCNYVVLASLKEKES